MKSMSTSRPNFGVPAAQDLVGVADVRPRATFLPSRSEPGGVMPWMSVMGRWAALLLVLAVAGLPARASADATYKFSFLGEAEQAGHSWAWTGTLTIVLDSGADGVYDDGHILSFDADSTVSSFHWPEVSFYPFDVFVDVADGRIISVDGIHYNSFYVEETTSFTGLAVHYHHPLIIKTPETFGDAVLIPLAVPEPGVSGMLLLGLGLVAAGGGVRRRAWPAHRPASH
jgi:hypothetical protein